MNLLLLNQCFYPDVVSTAQHLTDLAVELTNRGHGVTVITSDRGYDAPAKRFPRRETWKGIRVIRISSLGLGKATKLRRALNFGGFLINCSFRLAMLPRFDAVVALTSPPLISLLGSLFVRLKGGRFFFWVMDLNPDEAIVAGWLRGGSPTAKLLEAFSRHSLRHAEKVIVLDRFMKQRILNKDIPEQSIVVLSPWAHDDAVRYDARGREAFRKRHSLAESFVVMYSGNHSPCHPLDTLLEAALRLSSRKEISFCFVGGGSEENKVKEFAARHQLANILCLPYQPLEELAGSLSAADLHVVVMGEEFAGIVHPCKVYNILAVGSPLLYIGPEQSHVTDIELQSTNGTRAYRARHGDIDSVVTSIVEAAARKAESLAHRTFALPERFSRESVLPRMIDVLTINRQDTKELRARESHEVSVL